jgi:ATP-dependent DNA ligase
VTRQVVAKGDRRYGGADRKNRYGDLGEAFEALASRQALIDGEIIVQDERGSAALPHCRKR